jgi:glycyl-tRNA synthetase beta chain
MPELLLEIFSEEIPARMQARAADDLKRLVVEGLKARGLEVGEVMSFVTPRRLTLAIGKVPQRSPAISDERKGPRVGAPEKALEGFLKAAGLKSVNEVEIVKDAKRGDYYVVRIDKPCRAAAEIIAETVPEVMGKFPWPKSMRWGSTSFQWVRPIHSVLCLLGGKVVPFEVAGLASGDATRGHRFHGRDTIHTKSFEDYGRKLMDAKVLLPASERAAAIAEQARDIAKKAKLEWTEDDALVAENAGLTEWPTVYMGSFDEAFLDVPAECLMTSMKQHQKCFSLKDPKTGKLANKFLLVSNLIPTDGGEEIISGNEKVIAARLSDAKFFWEQDLKKPLDEMELALEGITFHEKLGTQKERVERIAELAHEIAGAVDADADAARRAAQLCKADLVSGMVGEFPELQGLMGRYYAEKAGTRPEIARAIELHYKPKGVSDTVPQEEDGDSVAIAVALADKLDTLIGFWAIDEKPTGSGDPYQLRRAALGVIRIVLENDLRLSLLKKIAIGERLLPKNAQTQTSIGSDLLAFIADRLKVYLRDQGKRHDLIDAVFALPGQDDLALIVKRVDALDGFLKTEDGANLLAGVKRASSILAIEEKKDNTRYNGDVSGPLLAEPAERDLAAAIAKVKFDTQAAINVENFEGAMRALSELRGPVDTFFDHVIVNADDKNLRENRLKLLNEIRAATLTVADFSKIAG